MWLSALKHFIVTPSFYLILWIISGSLLLNAQSLSTISKYHYNLGVEELQKGNYLKADSLFSISIQLEKNVDAYFNRALVKKKLEDKEGFCQNLHYAFMMKDSLAKEIYYKQCTKNDTIYKNNKRKVIAQHQYFPNRVTFIIDSFGIRNWYDLRGVNTSSNLDTVNYTRIDSSVFTMVNSLPEFPGGDAELMKFLRKNTIYPKEEIGKTTSGLVHVKFLVDEEGAVRDISVIWGTTQNFINEAVRVIKLLPKFTPAKMSGKPVKIYYNMPFSFKL